MFVVYTQEESLMCRTGGRRCPSNHNPGAISVRNSQRRQKYGASRLAAGHEYTPRGPVSDSVTLTELPAAGSAIVPRERLGRVMSGLAETSEDEFCLVSQRYDDKLGITISEHAGDFVDKGLFSSTSFMGKPQWENLDGSSVSASSGEQQG